MQDTINNKRPGRVEKYRCYISRYNTIYAYFCIQITMSNLSIYEENTYRYSKNVNTLSMIEIRLMFVQLVKADDFT